VHILTIQYWAQGTSENCCFLGVGTNPIHDPPGIWALDCDLNLVPATGVGAVINPNETCPCFNVPVEQSTWGKVKALYAE
jgi:hypothetical protein